MIRSGIRREDDRLYIRDCLASILGTESKESGPEMCRIVAIKKIVVFAPCAVLLQGRVLHDVPGAVMFLGTAMLT